jgi:hypothetical protein
MNGSQARAVTKNHQGQRIFRNELGVQRTIMMFDPRVGNRDPSMPSVRFEANRELLYTGLCAQNKTLTPKSK